jgi:ketosteroid isomerase-like protein
MRYGGVYRGGDQIAQNVFGPLVEDVPDFAITPEEFIASGNTVAAVPRRYRPRHARSVGSLRAPTARNAGSQTVSD